MTPEAAPAPKLSVVIGTMNRCEQLRACVESIFRETATLLRVYVTDAGSTDGTIEYLRSVDEPRLEAIFVGKRIGQARAYNEAFARIRTPYVCWLSDDNVVVNRGLDLAVRILDEHPRIGLVGLKVKDVTGPFMDAPYIGGISAIGILNVNQGCVRATILQGVGGFSETFRDYGIDPDLTAKVLFSGHQVVYTRPIAVHHFRNWSPDRSSEEFARQMDRQAAYQELYLRKYGGLRRGSLVLPVKTNAWRVLRRLLDVTIDTPRPVLGLLPRDWHNICYGRYISLLDPVRSRGRDFHLVQYCPSLRRPRRLPCDPPGRATLLVSVEETPSSSHGSP